MKITDWLLIGVAGAAMLALTYSPDATPTPNQPTPSLPNRPSPSPAPAPASGKLLIVVAKQQGRCPHCDRLKADWPDGYGIPHEYLAESRPVVEKWRVEGLPTLILLDGQGQELRRQLGYLPKEELSRWLQGSGLREVPSASAFNFPRRAAGANVTGPKHGDGTEVACDYPGDRHRKNTASKGLGLCVFTSIHHAADWQDVPALLEMPKWMISKGIAGGGYPSKVASLIPKLCQERGSPTPDYIQIESNDLEVLKVACAGGRMPCVTYAYSPTGRYGGRSIAHMVNLVHMDDKHAVILDNNYPGDDKYEWMTHAEFLRAYSGGRTGWAVIFLDSPPPPPPHNGTATKKDREPRPMPQSGYTCGRKNCDCGCRQGEGCRCAVPSVQSQQHVNKACPCSRDCTCGCNDGQPCQCGNPSAGPAVDPATHGVAWERIGERPRYRHGEYEVTRDDVMIALEKLPKDGKKLRVTFTGAKESRAKVEADWKADTAIGQSKDAFILKTYDPSHWHVAKYGFAPGLTITDATGKELYYAKEYPGAAETAATLRRLHPDYVPGKGGRILGGGSGGFPIKTAGLVAAAGAAAVLLARRKK